MKIKRIIDTRPYSDHPGDNYLSYVLCEIENKATPYVVWLHNSEDGGYYEGRYYFREDYEAAITDFLNRGN